VRLTGAGSNIAITNNVIHDLTGENAMGISVYGTSTTAAFSDLTIDGNDIHDCMPSGSEALTLDGNVTNFTVTNNLVHDVNNIGIALIGGEKDITPDPTLVARNGTVSGNTVYHARSNYGGGFAGGIYIDGGSDIVLEDNVCYENDLGIEVGAENKGIIAH